MRLAKVPVALQTLDAHAAFYPRRAQIWRSARSDAIPARVYFEPGHNLYGVDPRCPICANGVETSQCMAGAGYGAGVDLRMPCRQNRNILSPVKRGAPPPPAHERQVLRDPATAEGEAFRWGDAKAKPRGSAFAGPSPSFVRHACLTWRGHHPEAIEIYREW